MDEMGVWQILMIHGIANDKKWGTGGAKTYRDLTDEINKGECYLRIDDHGLTRVTRVVRMEITDQELGRLLEVRQVFPDGRTRERNKVPSGKLNSTEDPETGMLREMKEELRLVGTDPDVFSWSEPEMRREANESPSYPGLRSEYELHTFQITLSDRVRQDMKAGACVKEDVPDGILEHEFAWGKKT
jgi:hypothetical protein